MSSIIKLNEGNCQNCYKCIRHCPIKAISFSGGKVQIIEDECVLCGTCVDVCPQNARFTTDHRPKVLELLKGPDPVYVTLAPSTRATSPTSPLSSSRPPSRPWALPGWRRPPWAPTRPPAPTPS